MSFAESLNFTNGGREVQLKVQAGKQLSFTSVRLGDGTMTGTISAKTALINERASVNVNTVSVNSDYATIDAIFKNVDLSSGFYWKELGVFVANPDNPNDRNADILYAYQNVGELAEYIPAPSSALIEKIIHIPVFVGNVDAVSIAVNSIVQQESTVTQAEETIIEESDYLTFYDASNANNKKISFANIKKIINSISVEDISDSFIDEMTSSTDVFVVEKNVYKQGKVISGSLMLAQLTSWTALSVDEVLSISNAYKPAQKYVLFNTIGSNDSDINAGDGDPMLASSWIKDGVLYVQSHSVSDDTFRYVFISFSYICQ